MRVKFSRSFRTTCCAIGLVIARLAGAEVPNDALSFIEPVRGQTRADYAYIARTADYTAYLRADEALFAITPRRTSADRDAPAAASQATSAVHMHFVNASRATSPVAGEPLAGVSNYLKGQAPAHWIKGLPHYATVRFPHIYPGIDLLYTLDHGALRYDFIVAPGADPESIALRMEGGERATIDASGRLHVRGAAGELVQSTPSIYQEIDGERRAIDGGFVAEDDGVLSFRVAARDSGRTLVIDPRIEFATYLGGSGSEEGTGLALDAAGRIYISGDTTSSDFPSLNPLQQGNAGGRDAFIARLSADGQTLEYATYIGGSLDDFANQVTVDGAGNVLLVGYTSSDDFPTVNAIQPDFSSNVFEQNGYLLKLATAGDALVYSTYLGGPDPSPTLVGVNWARSVVVDEGGNAYVTGETGSAEFPVTQELADRGCLENEVGFFGIAGDGYVMKVAPNGGLVFSTCVGGSERDTGRGLALIGDGSIYFTGFTRSSDYPVTPGAFQSTYAGFYDAHVTHLSATATAILSATLLGGVDNDYPQLLHIAGDGDIIIAGQTAADFPTTPGAFQTSCHNSYLDADAFVTRLTPDLSDLVYSTCIGGDGIDGGWGMDIDDAGNVYVAGTTSSYDFPLADPTQTAHGGAAATVQEIGASGHALALAAAGLPSSDFTQFFTQLIAANDGIDLTYQFDADGSLIDSVELATNADRSRAVAIYDADGVYPIDRIVIGNDDAPSRMYLPDGNGGFLPPVDIGSQVHATRALVLADFRGSNDPDLIVGNYLEPTLYYPGTPGGLGSGVSALPGSSSVATLALAAGDLNGDGLLDVVAGTDGQANLVYFATTNRFRPGVAIGAETDVTTAIAVVDLDGDFDLDVVAGNAGAPNRWYRNRGDGSFDAAIDLDTGPASTSSLSVADLDPDGDLDILAGDGAAGTIYRNEGGGTFSRLPLSDDAAPAKLLVASPTWVYGTRADGPTLREFDIDFNDAFAFVLDASGSRLLYSSYVGGAGFDSVAWGLYRRDGSLYLAGRTNADDFPTMNALQPQTAGGLGDVFAMKIVLDGDEDGLLDGEDNCTEIANRGQRDTNGDGYGNACDPDLNNDGIVNFLDLGLMKAVFFGTDADADLNGDGHVNYMDLAILKQFFFSPPGPSGIGSEFGATAH